MKRTCALLLCLVLLMLFPAAAFAHDVPQDRDDCSIEIIVRYDGKNVKSGTLTAIKVGYVDEDDGNYFFSQEMTGIRITDITSSDAPSVQKEFYENNKNYHSFYKQTQSVSNGKATFSGLSTGLYLIVQNKAATGFSKLSPFLISVPVLEDGKYVYSTTAEIKSELEKKPRPTTPPTLTPPDDELPKTGQFNWPIPLMVVSGLTLFVTGWFLCFGKKREEHEK